MRGGNMKVVWIIVVATWVWWNAVVGQARISPLMVLGEHEHTLGFPTVSFNTIGATRDSFTHFIEALRGHLASGDKSFEKPVMRERSTVTDADRYVLVELNNSEEEEPQPVTLVIDVVNAYVVSYRTGNRYFVINDIEIEPAVYKVFPDVETDPLSFKGSYGDLARVAKENREGIDLGMEPLHVAIDALRRTNIKEQKPIARALTVVIQMVSEAARFRFIEHEVRTRIKDQKKYPPGIGMLNLENNWDTLSTAVQEASREAGGAFTGTVPMYNRKNEKVNVANVNHAAMAGVALLLFKCRSGIDPQPTNHHYFIINHHLLIMRPIGNIVGLDDQVATDVDVDDICEHLEPKVRIGGRNGLCVGVRDGKYEDGNPIVLSQCDKELIESQLWTFRKDRTIQSNGKCMTTSGFNRGDKVTIYDCTTAGTAATHWQVSINGTIFNPQSALALTADSGESGTPLTVETNIYASRQGWSAGNDTQPYVTSITLFDDLCMEADGDAVWVVKCENSKPKHEWALHLDGSIRPMQNQDSCLTSDESHSQGSVINISPCSLGSQGQRWVFMNDGTILNLSSGLVMDVKDSGPSGHQIIIMPVTGNPTQKWLPLF